MYWFIFSGAILLAAVLGWLWHRRAEQRRARAADAALSALGQSDDVPLAVAESFWFPALGAYGHHRETAVALLEAFEGALPAEQVRLRTLVRDARGQIGETGELEEQHATALRALFGAIEARGGMDEKLRAGLDSGALDWRLELAEDDGEDALTPEQREVVTDLRQALANGDSGDVVRRIDERIDGQGVQGVYRAALLDCRGRALLKLDRPEAAVSDFEAASRLAPDASFDDIGTTMDDT